jgi:hypothetical protein
MRRKDMEKNSEKVAKLNDAFRQELDNPFVAVNPRNQVTTTQGIWDCFDNEEIGSIFQDIRKFDNFNNENNPYKERDFGSLKRKGRTIFWKIDYYDNDLKYHSPDNTDPEQTKRVLTVMLASEY